jgi:hypothetical protein
MNPMSDFCERPTDPLDALLALPSTGPDDAFRRRVLESTAGVLRRRRLVRRLTRVAALAACYAAGLLTMHVLHPTAPPQAPSAVTASAVPAPVDQPAAPPSALAEEWEAVDHPDRAGELYRAAGDRYLAEESDPRAAVRCYGNALSAGPVADLTIEPGDSWLLVAIKDARQKERRDANRVE